MTESITLYYTQPAPPREKKKINETKGPLDKFFKKSYLDNYFRKLNIDARN